MQVLLFLAVGTVVGYLVRSRKGILATASKATTWSLYILIFLLGVSVGANEAVVRALGRLGVQALILCAGAVGGSVLVSCLVSRVFFRAASNAK
jgi:uncharacterized membrane protein YbjE (DUF340 family)